MTIDTREIVLWTYRAVGAGLAIGVMELLAGSIGEPITRVPFVTSIVLVMALPTSEGAQPRAIIGGHMVSGLCGLLCSMLLGFGDLPPAIAVGLATLAMIGLRVVHPPAGVNAFLVPLYQLPAVWLLKPVLAGAILLAAYSAVWHRGEVWLMSSRLMRASGKDPAREAALPPS